MSRVLELCQECPIVKLPAGKHLLREGDSELKIAVMKTGRVEVIKDNQPIAVVAEPGAIFGEMSVILQTTNRASIKTLEASEFYMIEDPYAFLWEKSEFHFELLKILAKRLDKTNQILADSHE